MYSFTIYCIKIINKYLTVKGRNYIQFLVNDMRVVDTLARLQLAISKSITVKSVIEGEIFPGKDNFLRPGGKKAPNLFGAFSS